MVEEVRANICEGLKDLCSKDTESIISRPIQKELKVLFQTANKKNASKKLEKSQEPAKAAKQAKARQAPTATVSAPLLALPEIDDAPPPPPPLAPAPGQQMQYYDQERVIYDGSQNYHIL